MYSTDSLRAAQEVTKQMVELKKIWINSKLKRPKAECCGLAYFTEMDKGRGVKHEGMKATAVLKTYDDHVSREANLSRHDISYRQVGQ